VIVHVYCEFTAEVRDAFARRGHDAWSCDLIPSERGGKHFQTDCRLLDRTGVGLLIAHPSCTNLCLSGVRWLYKGGQKKNGIDRVRWNQMIEDALFFRWLLELDIPGAIENPIPHPYALEIIGKDYDQIIQPWQFGHGETKATCLWLKGVSKLVPTNIVEGREQKVHHMAPSSTRGQDRSRTFTGIAKAMAEQWG
jgi:hypothetical protein